MAHILKKSACFILALFFLFTILRNPVFGEEVMQRPVRIFTIKDAVQVAFINNKAIQIQEEEIESAKANVTDAQGRFLPVFNVAGSYFYNEAVLNVSQSLAAGSKKDVGITTGYQNDHRIDFSVQETIYNGGANSANLKQARIGLKIQQETLRKARLDVEFETKRLFYGLLLAYETKRIAQDLVDQAQAHYEETNSRFGQGTASRFDVLQSKVQVSKLMPQLVQAENAIDLIKAEFKKLLSLDMRRDIEITGELGYDFIEIKEEDFLQESYQHNPQMILKLLGVDLNKWGIEYAKAGWLPQVNASFGYGYRSNNPRNMFNYKHTNWGVGAVVTLPIFDGFATLAKVEEARARYMQSVISKEDIVDQIALDVVDACLNLKQAKAIIDAEKDSVGEAKEALRLSEVRFNNGVGINLDVLDAQVSLAQVEQSLAQGKYDYIMAKAQLDKTMGKEFKEEAWH